MGLHNAMLSKSKNKIYKYKKYSMFTLVTMELDFANIWWHFHVIFLVRNIHKMSFSFAYRRLLECLYQFRFKHFSEPTYIRPYRLNVLHFSPNVNELNSYFPSYYLLFLNSFHLNVSYGSTLANWYAELFFCVFYYF